MTLAGLQFAFFNLQFSFCNLRHRLGGVPLTVREVLDDQIAMKLA